MESYYLSWYDEKGAQLQVQNLCVVDCNKSTYIY